MTLQNQIEYLNRIDGIDLFDDCSVPSGLDMNLVKGAIIMRCGLLTPLYSEPMTQRLATAQFFSENQWNFTQILKVLEAEYNPIENVFEDREETENTERQHDDSTGYGHITERKISAENVSTYSPDNQIAESGQDVRMGTNNENRNYNVHRHGNIGITSAQKLINESLDLVNRFNPYRLISELYERELIIGLY